MIPDDMTPDQVNEALKTIPRWKRWVWWPVAVVHTAAIFAGRWARRVPRFSVIYFAAIMAWAITMVIAAPTQPVTVLAWCAILATGSYMVRKRSTTVHNAPIHLTLSLDIDPSTGQTTVETDADAASIAPLPGLFDRNDERARRGMRGE